MANLDSSISSVDSDGYPSSCEYEMLPVRSKRWDYTTAETRQEIRAAVEKSTAKRYQCNLCGHRSSRPNIKDHVASHFVCWVGLCGMLSSSKSTIRRHYKQVHLDRRHKDILRVDQYYWSKVAKWVDINPTFPNLPVTVTRPYSQRSNKPVKEPVVRSLLTSMTRQLTPLSPLPPKGYTPERQPTNPTPDTYEMELRRHPELYAINALRDEECCLVYEKNAWSIAARNVHHELNKENRRLEEGTITNIRRQIELEVTLKQRQARLADLSRRRNAVGRQLFAHEEAL